jgi:peroxiredoxin
MRRELRVGEPAPELELPRETGEIVSLESLQGRAVLVSFLSHAA